MKFLEEEIFASWCLIAKIVKISASQKFPAIQYIFHLLVKYMPLLINHWIRFSTSHTVDTFFVLYFKHLKLEPKNFSSILGSFMVLTIPTHWQAFNSTGSINVHHDWNVYSATKMSPYKGREVFSMPIWERPLGADNGLSTGSCEVHGSMWLNLHPTLSVTAEPSSNQLW